MRTAQALFYTSLYLVSVSFGLLGGGCDPKKTAPVAEAPQGAGRSVSEAEAQPKPEPTAVAGAVIGSEAPPFELSDLDGKRVKLSDFRGKVVVLEWFNPDCPFVKMSHTKGSLVDTANRHTKNAVVWLAINSSAPGKQGHGVEKNREAQQGFKMGHPILLDDDGRVGKTYGAKRTPHMFVIDAKGVLVYQGAIDNSPDGEGQAAKEGKLVKYVEVALAELAAGRPIAVRETESYGCSVKYGS